MKIFLKQLQMGKQLKITNEDSFYILNEYYNEFNNIEKIKLSLLLFEIKMVYMKNNYYKRNRKTICKIN